MKIKTAIVEDVPSSAENITCMLDRYADENKDDIEHDVFPNGGEFLSHFDSSYQIVFMDINLPDGENGLEVARKMREKDSDVILIFVTDLAQFALKGYEVDAYDYIVKPVVYEHLKFKLDKIRHKNLMNEVEEIMVKTADGVLALKSSDIVYVEVFSHILVYHLSDGEQIKSHGSLKDVEKNLPMKTFSRCNNCYLVNLKYVSGINKYEVKLKNDEILQISHPKRKSFLDDFTNYLGAES